MASFAHHMNRSVNLNISSRIQEETIVNSNVDVDERGLEESSGWVRDGRCRSLQEEKATPLLDGSSNGTMVIMTRDEEEENLIRREFVHHDISVARVNNGSFGSCPASVLKAQARWAKLWLQQPDDFYFGPFHEGLLASRRAIASLIHAGDVEQVYLVDNTTTAVSMVLQRVAWDFIEGRYQKGDAVLALNWTYGAVKKALKAYPLRAGAELIEVTLRFPVSSKEQIISTFEETFKSAKTASKRIRFALIDHITSLPSIVLPIRELVSLCRRAGVDEIFVDGAHAVGSVELNVEEIDADYYSSNLHKWLFAPPTVAFFHCKRQHSSFIHHPIVSHDYENGLANECNWVGTRDYSAQLAAVDAVAFFSNFKGGVNAIRERNHSQVIAMGEMLANAWGTNCGAPPEMFSTMVMVRLPPILGITSNDAALSLRTRLRDEFGVEVPACFVADWPYMTGSKVLEKGGKEGAAYVRISYQIYNKTDDYFRLRDAVNSLVAEVTS